MPGFFDITSCAPEKIIEQGKNLKGKSECKVLRYSQLHREQVKALDECITKFPVPGEVTFVWVSAKFNGMSMIYWILQHCGRIEELVITTFSLSFKCIDSILAEIDSGNIGKLHFLVSTQKVRMEPQIIRYLETRISTYPNVDFAAANSHAKVTLARTRGGDFVICGSGNFSDNSNVEQYVIANSTEVYEFYNTCIAAEGSNQAD